jgi:hypothetical protein
MAKRPIITVASKPETFPVNQAKIVVPYRPSGKGGPEAW